MANNSALTDPAFITRDTATLVGVDAKDARYGLGGISQPSPGSSFGYGTGVFPGSSLVDGNGNPLVNDCRVSAGSSGLTSRIQPGNYQVARDGLGPYPGAVLNVVDNIAHPPADANNPRIDFVGLRIREPIVDGTAGTVTASVVPIVLSGSPAASPTEATASGKVTPGDIIFGAVRVPAGATTLAGATYYEKRRFITARGGINPRSSVDTSAGSYDADYADFGRQGGLRRWNGVDNVWETIGVVAEWNEYAPELYSGGNGGNRTAGTVVASLGTNPDKVGRYLVQGKRLDLSMTFTWGSAPYNAGAGDITARLPLGLKSRKTGGEQHFFCHLYVPTNAQTFPGQVFVRPDSNVLWFQFPNSANDLRHNYYKIYTTAGQVGGGVPYMTSGFPEGGVLSFSAVIEIQG